MRRNAVAGAVVPVLVAGVVVCASCTARPGMQASRPGQPIARRASASASAGTTSTTSGVTSAPTSPSATSPSAAFGQPGTGSNTNAGGARSTGGLLVASGDGWTASGLEGPVPASGTCQYRRATDGYLLPDPGCTPGAIDQAVTQSDLDATICRSGGYSDSVRPPYSLTEPFKRQIEAAYGDPSPTDKTELDHLVPLGLGGASDTQNLWPEPDQGSPAQFDPSGPYGINAKDGVEDRLHDAVCSGQVGLGAAQAAIATDWTTALAKLGLAP